MDFGKGIMGTALLVGLVGHLVKAQSVVPDGGTATLTTVDGAGKTTVQIAPADTAGTSLNTYARFNVPAAGVDLNNQSVGARTIVNQVTGTDPSILAGKLEVLGPRANVIIANPQGILVNGGVFQNMGGLILSTGQRSAVSRTVAPGVVQDNQVLNTTAGQIVIGPDGLSGAFTHLELIAKRITVDGPVLNTRAGANSSIRLTAGESRTEVDVSVSPVNDSVPWAQAAPGTASSPNAILVDMSSRMTMRASRIQIAVTDAGAGVRHAGGIHASQGDFTLTAGGEVRVEGGSVKAARDVLLSGSRLRASAAGSASPAVEAGRHIDVTANQVTWTGGGLIASGDGMLGDITLGRAGTPAAGTLTLHGGPSVLAVSAKGGGVGLLAEGHDLDLADVQLTASQTLDLRGRNLFLRTTREDRQTFLSAGQVTPALTGSAVLAGARMLSETDLSLQVTRYSAMNLGALRSELRAAGGALVLRTSTGDIENLNSLIQGGRRNVLDPFSLGAVTLDAAGSVVNRTDDARHLAILFAEDGDLSLTAAGRVENTAGRLISNRDILLTTPDVFLNRILRYDVPNAGRIEEYTRPAGGFLFFSARARGWRIGYGDLVLPDKPAQVVALGDVVVNAGSVANLGGEMAANDGSILITSPGRVESSAVISGSAWFEKTTGFMTRRSNGESSLRLHGGKLSASRSLIILAGGGFTSTGGELLAFERLRIDAPTIDIRSLRTYTVYTRKNGLRGIFGGGSRKVKLLAADQGGTLYSLDDAVALNAGGPVTVDGGVVAGARGISAPQGLLILREPAAESPVDAGEHFGFLGGFF